MGTDKAFLPIGDKTFLENAVEILAPVCESVKIVLNKSQKHFIEKLPDNILHIFDIHENRGAPGGIHAAFKNCETEFAVILAVDLPFVTSEMIEKLSEIAIDFENMSAFVPRQNDGKLQPLFAVYRIKDCLPKLDELLSNNNSVSVRDFLEKRNLKIIPAEDLSDNDNLFANINFPQDLLKIND